MMRRLLSPALSFSIAASLAAQTLPPRDTRPAPRSEADSGTIRGVVLSDAADPRPLRNARVSLIGSSGPPRMTSTADDGAFAFTGLAAGRYMIAASKDAYVQVRYGAVASNRAGTSIEVRSGATEDITIRLPRGTVITGVITAADGQPRPGVMVHAYRLGIDPVTGTRRPQRIVSGVAQTISDDRGVYRIFGLPAGEYIVGAAAPPTNPWQLLHQVTADEVRRALAEVRNPSAAGAAAAAGARSVTLVPVYYPGTASAARATRVAVRAGEERGAIDIAMDYVPAATVEGTVANLGPGVHTAITIMPLEEVEDRGSTRHPDGEGRFIFTNVAPGSYLLLARGGSESRTGELSNMHWAAAEVTVDGQDVTGIVLSVQPTVTISGRLAFEGTPPELGTEPRPIRSPPVLFGGRVSLTAVPVEIRGDRFSIAAIVPGAYALTSALPGVRSPIGRWWLKSVMVQGRDLLDAPLEFRQSVDDAVATFSERASELKGTVAEASGAPAGECWVVAFSTNPQHWFAHSRRIAGVRSSLDGRYSIRNLPAGDYLLGAAGDLEVGEWFDPGVLERLATTAVRVSLEDGGARVLDVRTGR